MAKVRRLEYKDAKSHKFWELSVEGTSFTVRYGKVGTDGQMKTTGCASEAAAEAAGTKKLNSKVKKGYVEVEVGKADATAEEGRNPALEAAIFDDPGNEEAWQVYADWLQQEGDPHGELISLEQQSRSAKGKDKAALDARIAEITEAHQKEWLGGAAKILKHKKIGDTASLEWQYGYVIGASVGCGSDHEYAGPTPDKILRALVKAPATRFLRNLSIGTTYDNQDWFGRMDKNVQAICRSGKLEALTRLHVGDGSGYWDISSTIVGKISDVLPIAPRLSSLYVRGNDIQFTQLVHEALETLTVETGGLSWSSARAIAKAELPNITSMTVYFGADNYGGNASVSDLTALWKNTKLPKLRHLGLCNSEFQGDIAKAIAGSKIIKQLTSLDLSMGTMVDAQSEVFTKKAKAFAHLERLDISDNFLSDERCEAIAKALPKVHVVRGQREADEYDGEIYTYVSVGE
ncbi:WGR domain protein [Plesiocystis pacifica SIR-1]|uniref:WGR domain protein n=1 Tax=Plesiocystis pacifica SIR-1 TaxID=391625 RepID=A6G6B0_9BACT|nr:WGR domain-containing protein [Plesiocystis pacifica]EDM78539.1 WGR domain protein [Plesiocystis pacifica SIR-1]